VALKSHLLLASSRSNFPGCALRVRNSAEAALHTCQNVKLCHFSSVAFYISES